MKVMIDFHYSDSWTDAWNQAKPDAWAADTLTTPTSLGSDIFWYTSNAIYTLAHKYHVAADYIEIGNEVTYGMPWPDGSLNDGGHGGWANWTGFMILVNQGIAGARRGAGKAGISMPRTIIHISLGNYWGVVGGFFSGLAAAKDRSGHPVRYDVIGLSYYPDNKTDLSDIKETLTQCAANGKVLAVKHNGVVERSVGRLLLEVWHPGQAVRLIGVGVSGLAAPLQLDLWDMRPAEESARKKKRCGKSVWHRLRQRWRRGSAPAKLSAAARSKRCKRRSSREQ